ncbi:hypothetical protein EC968_001078 [Mortierella alpina]|nr:hypothetical protein EC968_001078 [Mortierella alpina]
MEDDLSADVEDDADPTDMDASRVLANTDGNATVFAAAVEMVVRTTIESDGEISVATGDNETSPGTADVADGSETTEDDADVSAVVHKVDAPAGGEVIVFFAVEEADSNAADEGSDDLSVAVEEVNASEVAIGNADGSVATDETTAGVDSACDADVPAFTAGAAEVSADAELTAATEVVESPAVHRCDVDLSASGEDVEVPDGTDGDSDSTEAVDVMRTVAGDEGDATLSAVLGEAGAPTGNEDDIVFSTAGRDVGSLTLIDLDAASSEAAGVTVSRAVTKDDNDLSSVEGEIDACTAVAIDVPAVPTNIKGDAKSVATMDDAAALVVTAGDGGIPVVPSADFAPTVVEDDSGFSVATEDNGTSVGPADGGEEPVAENVLDDPATVADDTDASLAVAESNAPDANGSEAVWLEGLDRVESESRESTDVEGDVDVSAAAVDVIPPAPIEGDVDRSAAADAAVAPTEDEVMAFITVESAVVDCVMNVLVVDGTLTSTFAERDANASPALDVMDVFASSEREATLSDTVDEIRTSVSIEDSGRSVAVVKVGGSVGITGDTSLSAVAEEVDDPVVTGSDSTVFVAVSSDSVSVVTEGVDEASTSDCGTSTVTEEAADRLVAPDEADEADAVEGTVYDVDLPEIADRVGVPWVAECDAIVSVTEDETEVAATADEVDAFAGTADEAVCSATLDAVAASLDDDTNESTLVDIGSPAVHESEADSSATADEVGTSPCAVIDVDIVMDVEADSSADSVLDLKVSVVVGVDPSEDAALVDADSGADAEDVDSLAVAADDVDISLTAVDSSTSTVGDVNMSVLVNEADPTAGEIGVSARVEVETSINNVDDVVAGGPVGSDVVPMESAVVVFVIAEVDIEPTTTAGEVAQ